MNDQNKITAEIAENGLGELCIFFKSDGDLIGATYNIENKLEDANAVVKAVNNHDKLVEALVRIIDNCENHASGDHSGAIEFHSAKMILADVEFARDRVAKAKGGD